MATQKWESVTWEWLEREIVDCLLIAGKRQGKPGLLSRVLTDQPTERVTSAMSARNQAGEHNNA